MSSNLFVGNDHESFELSPFHVRHCRIFSSLSFIFLKAERGKGAIFWFLSLLHPTLSPPFPSGCVGGCGAAGEWDVRGKDEEVVGQVRKPEIGDSVQLSEVGSRDPALEPSVLPCRVNDSQKLNQELRPEQRMMAVTVMCSVGFTTGISAI